MANGSMSATIDTLKVADALQKEGGFSEQQAHTLAEQFGEIANNQLVTREYLDYKLEGLEHKIEAVASKIEKLELRMTIKIGVVVAAVLTLFKMLESFF